MDRSNPTLYYTWLFPQLTLGIQNGTKTTEAYKDIVLRGECPKDLSLPIDSDLSSEIIRIATPLGDKDCLYLKDRNTFEYFVKALAYKCEEVEIPRSTGAIFISGLNCWRKIEAHQEEFLKNHSMDEWDGEFDRFIQDKNNFQESILLISEGPYSNVKCDVVGYSKEEWLKMSKMIRIYHELSHYISRNLFLEHKDAIRDEVIADAIGIFGCLHHYDKELEKSILLPRLENYVEQEKLEEAKEYAIKLIEKLDAYFVKKDDKEPFDCLLEIEKQYIK